MKRLNKKNRVGDDSCVEGIVETVSNERYSLSNEEVEFMLTMRLN